LKHECETGDGREARDSIHSEHEGEKVAASLIFRDLGITSAITGRHSTYQGKVMIAVPRQK
jgi:hypothetical protein